MYTSLSPYIAASIAARVYDIRKSSSFNSELPLEFRDNFKISNSQIQGVSGGLVNQLLNRSTGFALTAQGISPQFKQHHIIGVRGTVFTSFADWLTNGNIATVVGPKSLEVHSGFEKAFSSMQSAFNDYITRHNPSCLHVVGHSLGGAIAQLTALWASEKGINTKLYTFGAPRVVTERAVHQAATNIEHYRVTHGADPVPAVPVWPFSHTVAEYQTAMNNGAFFSIGAHSMVKATPGYVNTAASYKSYSAMDGALKTRHHKHTVLNYEQRHNASFSQRWQQIITDALITLLKKTGQYAFILAQASLSHGLQFYDILARCLHGVVVKSSDEIAEELRGLLGHMLVFAGNRIQAVKEMSVKFIRWVLGLMIKTLYTTAKQAIELVS
ncbi:lipase family protein [Shewanella sp. Scap07]|uniref:lipase family protein n=1 Tax=Shewanella sp. Scap07 TaxID=2589987 RepID=UPI0015BF2426|nr:lipase family protein [Shewanella sp. Scap07]QLE83691.1 lipase family protein [Shewanella sp. Scap07]